MSNVVALHPRERTECDGERLRAIRAGQEAADEAQRIGTKLEDLASQLSCVGLAYRDGRFDRLNEHARAVSEMAAEIGLHRLARVGRTVCVLAGQDNPAALAANLARLLRLGDAALTAIWDVQDRGI